jgi:sulfite exporter TauE/SafE
VWLESLGRGSARAAGPAAGWQRLRGPVKAGSAGLVWAAWPCGLLQSALVLAALANSPAGGALVMTGFALVSATGLMAGPALWSWIGGGAVAARAATWAVRLSGAMIAGAAGFALTHGIWAEVAAWCFS